ncbi:MAG TPA: hypothetical protein DGT21_14270 [Armatimonadetes bacterium]|jgi:hypothetical protein|nr:hypothetical protein [Armatimonadota bacterium]
MHDYRYVVIPLDKRDRELLLSVDVLPPEIEEVLTEIEGETALSELCLPLDLLDELVGCLVFAANHTDDRARQKQLDRLYGRLANQLDKEHALAEDGPIPGPLDQDPLMELFKMLGIPSPMEAATLLYADWDDPFGAVQLNEDLTEKELKRVGFLANTRILLAALEEADGVKATATGNLNRKFVGEMLDVFHVRSDYLDDVRRHNKVVNELDFFPLHVVNVVSQLAGLHRRVKGHFRITRKGREFLAEDKMGSLCALLFKTHFRKLNLAYLDRAPDLSAFQQGVAYSLYMVPRLLTDWHAAEDVAPLLVLGGVACAIQEETRIQDVLGWIVQTRLLRPLETFGLLEGRERKTRRRSYGITQYRKTDLFDRFLRFDLSVGVDPTQV